MLSKITDMLIYLCASLIDISSSFHQNIHHLSVSLLTGSVEWTETILYSERELMRHSWLTTDHSSPSLDTRRPDIHLSQVSSSSNLHKSIIYTWLTVKTSHILLTIEHDMDSKPCQEWRLQPQPWATDVQPQHDLWQRLTVEQCLLSASGGDTETSGAAVNELSQKWDYTFTSREPHILSPGVDIHRSGEESLNCLHISSLSSIVELCSSLGIETRVIRRKIVLGINPLQKVVHYNSHCRLQYSSVGPDCDRAGQLLVCLYSCLWGSP